MGHIELATPVSHIWYLKGIPSRMAQVIDVSPKDLEEVIYFVSYICLNAGTTDLLKYREVLDETTARSRFTDIINQIKEKLDETGHYIKVENILNKLDSAPADEIYGDLIGAIAEIQKEFDLNQVLTDDVNLNDLVNDLKDEDSRDKLVEVINAIMQAVDTTKELTRCSTLVNRLKNPKSGFDFLSISPFISKYTGAEFGSGAEAVQRLLKDVDINAEFLKVQAELKETQGSKNQKRIKLIKRLEVLDAFRQSSNKPEWMVLNVLPVIPPELRPMHLLDATRVANSDLNDLYRRVIGRNNRLKKWLEMKAPSVMIINEKRLIQEAVDSLIDNGRRGKPVTGAAGRPLKSLSNTLKGKQGRFRQNLLGKRVDFEKSHDTRRAAPERPDDGLGPHRHASHRGAAGQWRHLALRSSGQRSRALGRRSGRHGGGAPAHRGSAAHSVCAVLPRAAAAVPLADRPEWLVAAARRPIFDQRCRAFAHPTWPAAGAQLGRMERRTMGLARAPHSGPRSLTGRAGLGGLLRDEHLRSQRRDRSAP
jgi:hypothetical protein